MRRARVVPVKHGMSSLILALNEAEVKEEAIPVQIHQGNIETQQLENDNEKSAVMVHVVQINQATTLPLPTEGQWRQDTSEDHDFGYIKTILPSPEEKPIEPK